MFLKSYRENDNNNAVTVIIKLTKALPPAACVQLYNVIFRRSVHSFVILLFVFVSVVVCCV